MKSYIEWRKEIKRENYRSEEHPPSIELFEELENEIVDAMVEDGPDGHCDGSELITAYILEEFIPFFFNRKNNG